MSALANTLSADKKNQNLSGSIPSKSGSSTDISVITRIDYNLRFTKQSVLVVASNSEDYSPLASQFLVTLSNSQPENSINVAFVAASIKLNDIQIRCRLIEQLFVNTLFDPEESLAVSVLRLAKQHGEAISIVIDHAHALSLQVKYELSQLVSFAKKNKLTINVVLFGLIEAAEQLAENKSIFKNKMVVINALSGQVISLDNKESNQNKLQRSLSLGQKLSLLTVIAILVGILVWGYQLIAEDMNKQSTKTKQVAINGKSIDNNKQLKVIRGESAKKDVRAMQRKQKIAVSETNSNEPLLIAASNEDITNAILALPQSTINKIQPAKANDVIKALALNSNSINQNEALISSVDKKVILPTLKEHAQLSKVAVIDSNYYYNQAVIYDQGYVIQIAGFADEKLWRHFVEEQTVDNFFSYKRLLNGSSFIVVTSKVYANKDAAKAALNFLPASLSERKPWLKDISSLIKEINTFKG